MLVNFQMSATLGFDLKDFEEFKNNDEFFEAIVENPKNYIDIFDFDNIIVTKIKPIK